jgi:transposase
MRANAGRLGASRRELFEKLDRPALRPLPAQRYEFLEWKTAKVGIDYHIAVGKHCYSMPYQLVGQQVEVRVSATTVEILHKNRRVGSHLRSQREGGFTTQTEDMPKSHQRHLEWTPSRIIHWAQQTGPHTGALVECVWAANTAPSAWKPPPRGAQDQCRLIPEREVHPAVRP